MLSIWKITHKYWVSYFREGGSTFAEHTQIPREGRGIEWHPESWYWRHHTGKVQARPQPHAWPPLSGENITQTTWGQHSSSTSKLQLQLGCVCLHKAETVVQWRKSFLRNLICPNQTACWEARTGGCIWMETSRSAVFMQCQVLACTVLEESLWRRAGSTPVSLFSPYRKDWVNFFFSDFFFIPSTGGWHPETCAC